MTGARGGKTPGAGKSMGDSQVSPRAPRARARARGALALVLHTHMPYVEGFGTWPFGEEWLWEAIACCYLPLLDLLDDRAPALTLSLTPVLADQLSAPDLATRFTRFIEETRRYTHAEDVAGLRGGGHPELAAELERAWRADYEHAAMRLAARGGDLLGAFAPHVSWTSAATHAVLPLLAADASVRLQIQGGIAAHRTRLGGRWSGGFWLPECAYAPHLEPILAQAGVRATCVELTNHLGLGAPAHLRPLASAEGPILFAIDRATISLLWSDAGYPADMAYRDYHRHTTHHHNPWRNDGAPYDHELALARAREHAADFVARTHARLRHAGASLPGGGLVVCALDTELLGHWWYEGLHWLEAVLQECERQGLELVELDERALERFTPAPAARGGNGARGTGWDGEPGWEGGTGWEGETGWEGGGTTASGAGEKGRPRLGERCPPGTWGANGDLSTWSGPPVADLAFAARAAELEVLAAACQARAGPAAVRELLALQASDWPFMITRGLALPYAHERFEGHRAALARALADGPEASVDGLRELARHADPALLLAP